MPDTAQPCCPGCGRPLPQSPRARAMAIAEGKRITPRQLRDRASMKAKTLHLLTEALRRWPGVIVRDLWDWTNPPRIHLGVLGQPCFWAEWKYGEDVITLRGSTNAEQVWADFTGKPVKVRDRRPVAVPAW